MLLVLVAASQIAAAPTQYQLVSGEIGFSIEAPLDTITGASRGIAGVITLDPAAVATAPSARIDVNLASFTTGIALRDEDLRDQFLETTKFAKASLTVGALERTSAAALAEGGTIEAVAAGTLDLHGKKNAVQIPVRMTLDKGQLTVAGDFLLPILDFGMKRPQRLIFKLGTDVKVSVRGTFKALPSSSPPVAVSDAVPAASVPPQVVVALEEKKPPKPRFTFAEGTPEGRGERAFVSSRVGGKKNVLACKSCHATHDERKGLNAGSGIKPNSTMWNAAQRSVLWQGLANTSGGGADICAQLFMLAPDGLDPKVKADLEAYMKKISPDPQPALDYGVLHMTRRTVPADVAKGDAANGKKLIGVYCTGCHDKDRMRPPLEQGLYEADMIVSRVRRQFGADNLQMPPISIERLPDSDLRDIVTWLTDEKQRIFVRKKKPAPAAPGS